MKRKEITLICLFMIWLAGASNGQNPANSSAPSNSLEMDSILKQGDEYNFIKPLVGKWKAVQSVYSREGKILVQDTFKVERKMIGNFLQEIMEPLVSTQTNSFTRISYLSYNRVNLRWEYIVLDTRFPLMMFETSASQQIDKDKSIHLYLGAFILPPFFGKEYTGQLTKEHRIITFKDSNTYIHEQYWTMPAAKEFLAIKYVFTKS